METTASFMMVGMNHAWQTTEFAARSSLLLWFLIPLSFCFCFCLGGCTSDKVDIQVPLSWSFVDGRPCDLAGVVRMRISGTSPDPLDLHCEDGLAPEGFYPLQIGATPILLSIDALSLTHAVLYRGVRDVEIANEQPLTISLRFVGGDRQ